MLTVACPDFSSGSKQFAAHKLFENDIAICGGMQHTPLFFQRGDAV